MPSEVAPKEAMSAVLSPEEREALAACEREIVEGAGLLKRSFILVGRALRVVKERRLYRAEYSSFEAYCRERWKMHAGYAFHFIASAAVVENLSGFEVLPENEAQARHLGRLHPGQQRDAWREAVATAPNGKVTKEHVRRVVAAIKPEESRPGPGPGKLPRAATATPEGTIGELVEALIEAKDAGWEPARTLPLMGSHSETLAALTRWVRKQAELARRMKGA